MPARVVSQSFEAAGETSPCSIHEPTISGGRRRETAHLLQRLINCEGRRLSFGAGFRRPDHSSEKRPWPRGAHIAPTPGAEEIIAIALRAGNYPTFAQPVCSENQRCVRANTIKFGSSNAKRRGPCESAARDHPAFARELCLRSAAPLFGR